MVKINRITIEKTLLGSISIQRALLYITNDQDLTWRVDDHLDIKEEDKGFSPAKFNGLEIINCGCMKVPDYTDFCPEESDKLLIDFLKERSEGK